MLDFIKNGNKIIIRDSNKKEISFDTETKEVTIDGFDISFPGEYEKSGILAEVRDFSQVLFYNLTVDSKHIVIITTDKIELKEDILLFFGDIDILIIIGTKDSVKIFENLEAKLVIPYGEQKDIFLNILGQHVEPVENYKLKGELNGEKVEFINLK